MTRCGWKLLCLSSVAEERHSHWGLLALFCFSGWGWTAVLGHCDYLDIVLSLRACTGRNHFCLRRD